MYMAMLGAAAFMNWRGGLKTSQGMFWFAVGGVFGWPFAIALCAPFVAEECFFAVFSDKERFFEAFLRLLRGVVATLLLIVRPLVLCIYLCSPVASAKNSVSSLMASSTPSSIRRSKLPHTILSSTISFRRLAAPSSMELSPGTSTSRTLR